MSVDYDISCSCRRLLLQLGILSVAVAAQLPLASTRFSQSIDDWKYFTGTSPEKTGRFWDRALLRHATGTVDYDQLGRLVRKLQAGQRVVVMGVGSSVTACHGGHFEARPGMVEAVVPMRPRPEPGSTDGFLNRLMQAINTTWPHPDHVLYNSGKTGSSFYNYVQAACLEAILPNVTVDLLVAEFLPHWSAETDAFAEGIQYNYTTEVLEQYMWRIHAHYAALHLSSPPYIFIRPLTFGDNITAFEHCTRSHCDPAACASFGSPFSAISQRNGQARAQWRNEERAHSTVKYFGQSSLSLRYMFYAARKSAAMRNLSDCQLANLFYGDIYHPSRLGQVLYADLLVNLIADTEQHLHTNAPTSAPAPASPPAPAPHNAATAAVLLVASTSLPNNSSSSSSSSPSLLHKNLDDPDSLLAMPEYALTLLGRNVWHTRCYGDMHQAHLQDQWLAGSLLPLDVVARVGWAHVVNQTHLKRPDLPPKHKPGWVSSTVGATLQLRVSTVFSGALRDGARATDAGRAGRTGAGRGAGARVGVGVDAQAAGTSAGGLAEGSLAQANAVITLMFLRSYLHMGSVSVACMSGCACPTITIDAHNGEQVSVSEVRDLGDVTPHEQCIVGVTILAASTSPGGEHKFKLIQVVAKVKGH